jgi:F0F1-type ATP synthase assembly protein I
MNGPGNKGRDEFRTAVTTTVVLVAGLTLVVIFVGLFTGIILDRVFNSKPLFTVILIIASVPATILLTLRVVKMATRRIQPGKQVDKPKEDLIGGKDD